MKASRDARTLRVIKELRTAAEEALKAGVISKKEFEEVASICENPKSVHWQFVKMMGEIQYKHGKLIREKQADPPCSNKYDSPEALEEYRNVLEEAYKEGAIDFPGYQGYLQRFYKAEPAIPITYVISNLQRLTGEAILNREHLKNNPYIFMYHRKPYDVRPLLDLEESLGVESIVQAMDTAVFEALGSAREEDRLMGSDRRRLQILIEVRNAFLRFSGQIEMVDWLESLDKDTKEQNLKNIERSWPRASLCSHPADFHILLVVYSNSCLGIILAFVSPWYTSKT
jgi:hypothetical protein